MKMDNKPKSDLNSYFLYNRSELLLKIFWLIAHSLGYIVGFPFSMTINPFGNKVLFFLKSIIGDSSSELVQDIQINFFEFKNEEYDQIINQQKKQYSIYFLLGSIPFFISILIFFNFISKFFGELFTSIVLYLIYGFAWLTIQIIYSRLLVRTIEYLIPETLCVMQIINLNLELTRDDVIYRRNVKSMILFRMDYLARVTMLIPWHYSIKKSSNQKWIEQHFQNISYYIRERRRWLIAPNETTLDDLRRDFRKLAYYYLTGKYGAWEWQSFELQTEVVKQTRFQKIQGTLIRFVGIILPLLIMAFYILFPGKFPNPDAKILENLPYIFIAWLLVSLDITLKLGVIESLTKLITGLKDLSK